MVSHFHGVISETLNVAVEVIPRVTRVDTPLLNAFSYLLSELFVCFMQSESFKPYLFVVKVIAQDNRMTERLIALE